MDSVKEQTYVLDRVFKEKTEYIGSCLDIYKKIYSIPIITYEGEVSEELYNYVTQRKHFLLLSIYDNAGRIYLERNLQEKLYWSLPGGSVRKNEDFHAAVARIANGLSGTHAKLLLGEVEPVAFVENKFTFNDRTYTHYGIAFMARIRNKDAINFENSGGSFVNINEKELNNINRYANKEVARLCNEKIRNSKDVFPELEVSANEKHQYRYFIHNNIVKRFILTPRLKKKRDFIEMIDNKICDANSIIDVSCGDSDILKQIISRRDVDCVVGNDISWSQVGFINNEINRIVYTNHNAAHLPFKNNSFDVSYCGNTLHHMTSRKEMLSTFDSMFRVSKKIVIVEIEKPKNTGLFPHILNKYWYQRFLGDVGGSYLSKSDFQSIIKSHFSDVAEIEFDEFKNIQGRYLMAKIVKKEVKHNKVLEVEQKFVCNNVRKFEQLLSEEGYSETEPQFEEDVYYSDLGGDFIKNRTCLRSRLKANIAEITHKGKSTSFVGSFAKIEHNIIVSKESLDDYNSFFNSLGYSKYVSVEKNRRTFIKNAGIYDYSISIDDVNNIGKFIEFEVSASADNEEISKKAANKILIGIINKFKPAKLEPADVPYRDYVANYYAKKFLKKDNLKAVLFDLDGTILPTEMPFFESFRDVIREMYGKDLTLDEYRQNEMAKDSGLIDHLISHGMEIRDRDSFMRKVYSRYEEKLDALLSEDRIIDCFSSVEAIKSTGYRVGLVTTSRRKYVDKILSKLGAENLFEEIVAREDVKNKKPDPESYELMLQKMKVLSKNCLVVEDSARGLESAKSAGINCVLVAKHALSTKDEMKNMDAIVLDDITQLYLLLAFA